MGYVIGILFLIGFIRLVRLLARNPTTTVKVAGGLFKFLR